MMEKYNFDEEITRQGTNCIKHDTLKEHFGKEELLPLWVADMDFRTPDFILEAIKRRCEHPVFGYTFPPEEYAESIIQALHTLHGWEVKGEWISYIPGIVKGIAFALVHFTKKGDKVIIQPPVYHPFQQVPEALERQVVTNPLRLENGCYQMDFDHLESLIDDQCKLLILSNPHNPAGVVWEKETLQRLAAICAREGILVISDEIHSEMVYPQHTHHPFPTVSPEAASCSITFSAPSKTYNIAGIVTSYAIVPDDTLRQSFYSFLKAGEFNNGTIFAYTATIAAYKHGGEWRRKMLDYVQENIRFVETFLQEQIPQITIYQPQASFLIWLDCRALQLTQEELVKLFVDKAGLALNDGAMFGKEGKGFMRINIGTPRATLEKALHALKKAVV